jgi:hypothetical protein
VKELMKDESMNFLRDFSTACRDDLHPLAGF